MLSAEITGVDPNRIAEDRQPAFDVFNVDEIPDSSLTTNKHTKGTNKSKHRITVVLATNADGSEKLRPLMIGKSVNPRCFKTINHKRYADYDSIPKAWMTSSVLATRITKFDRKMCRADRKILLMLDNALSHNILNLTNIKLHFLPLNTTTHLQPLDVGVINSVKAHYRECQLQHIVDS